MPSLFPTFWMPLSSQSVRSPVDVVEPVMPPPVPKLPLFEFMIMKSG